MLVIKFPDNYKRPFKNPSKVLADELFGLIIATLRSRKLIKRIYRSRVIYDPYCKKKTWLWGLCLPAKYHRRVVIYVATTCQGFSRTKNGQGKILVHGVLHALLGNIIDARRTYCHEERMVERMIDALWNLFSRRQQRRIISFLPRRVYNMPPQP
jgi:hypothetical protein